MSTDAFTPGPHTTVRRSDRARYERDEIYRIVDEAELCHVGFIHDGRPAVIPMLHVRAGDSIMLHGAHPSRLARSLEGQVVSITATILDGWVLAKSAFHHSANYRSAVLYGRAERVHDHTRKAQVLNALTERIVPGRPATLRPTTDKEVRGTALLEIPITEASAKVRTGPPVEDDADLDLPIWAGVIPVVRTFGDPVPAHDLHPDATEPDHLGFFRS
jgi:nitroimidazol reductase NimA-like FMN-containing flavoprotein (pyridoxamine 5'-phosphate oxidase superfamily)